MLQRARHRVRPRAAVALPVDSPTAPRRRLNAVWVGRIAILVALLALWEVTALIRGPFFLPTIESVFTDGMSTMVSQGYLGELGRTWVNLLLGFAIACAVAIPLGALMGWFRPLDWFLGPYATSLFVTPTVALLPLVILVVGTGVSFQVVVVFLFAFFYPLTNTAAGVRNIPAGYLELARAFCLKRRQLITRVVVPATVPYVLVGLRLGLGMAVQGIIAAELWIAAGTGGTLKELTAVRALPPFLALTAVTLLAALALTEALRLVERRWVASRGEPAAG